MTDSIHRQVWWKFPGGLLTPWASGDRMKLSDFAVIVGVAASAQLGGVVAAPR